MKNLLLADFHGKDPRLLIEQEKARDIERVVSLGDDDNPAILKSLQKLEIEFLSVPGNHDIVHAKGKYLSPWDPWSDVWKQYPEEKKFILDSRLKIIEETKNGKIIYLHSSLEPGGDGFGDYILWGQLESSSEKIKINFDVMRKKGCWILFRAHEHKNNLWSIKKSDKYMEVINNWQGFNKEIFLEDDRRYIVSIGAFEYGDYCFFDDKKGLLKFKRFIEEEFKGP